MQKINKNGVTLIALVVTVIVLFIIIGIAFESGKTEIDEIKNKRIKGELVIVQEAVMQRLALIKAANQIGITATVINDVVKMENDAGRPSEILGARIPSSNYVKNLGFQDVNLLSIYSSEAKKYEEYYYLLDENDLKKMGIEKGEKNATRSYIVNYSTGEVFDAQNKEYAETSSTNGGSVHLKPSDVTITEKDYDFNDD